MNIDLPNTLAFLGNFGWTEGIILLAIGVLIFGKRLPEVGKSLGKGIVEFKKGLHGIEDEVNSASSSSSKPPSALENSGSSNVEIEQPQNEKTEA